jgi:hypothetical protein
MKCQTQKSRRLLELGVIDFETPTDVARLQTDLVVRLTKTSVDPARLDGLSSCTEAKCGRGGCIEPCWWRRRRERRNAIPALHRLFSSLEGPVCVVRMARQEWTRPYGHLSAVPIKAVKQATRRFLDSFYNANTKAIGSFKVAPDNLNVGGRLWVAEVHLIVVGIGKEELDKKLYRRRWRDGAVSAKLVSNLGQAISDVLRCDALPWVHPAESRSDDDWMSRRRREELYLWTLAMKQGQLLIRYGLDRRLAPIAVKQRVRLIKPRKRAPRPTWLKKYRHGYDPADDQDLDLPVDPGKAAIWRRFNHRR